MDELPHVEVPCERIVNLCQERMNICPSQSHQFCRSEPHIVRFRAIKYAPPMMRQHVVVGAITILRIVNEKLIFQLRAEEMSGLNISTIQNVSGTGLLTSMALRQAPGSAGRMSRTKPRMPFMSWCLPDKGNPKVFTQMPPEIDSFATRSGRKSVGTT